MNKELKEKFDKLLYCCECLHIDYSARNYGDAERWLRHIDKAYEEYQDLLNKQMENQSIVIKSEKGPTNEPIIVKGMKQFIGMFDHLCKK